METQVAEIIGQTQETQLWRYTTITSLDRTVADYEFWDQLRRGFLPGYEYGALFCNPMNQIVASYVLGDGIEFALDDQTEGEQGRIDYTNDLLSLFSEYLSNLLYINLEDLYGLADLFLVMNSDGSISIPAPHTVKADYDEDDYRLLVKVTITTIHKDHKTEDVYTKENREIRVYRKGRLIGTEVYPNLIGRIPIVHLANDRGINETHGRVLYDGLLPVYQAYNDLMEKGITGAQALGNPIPVLSGLKGVQSVSTANQPIDDETYEDRDGNTETRHTINLDRNSILLLGEGARADMLAPPTGFTEDTRGMLKSLFLILLDHSRIPEALWGGAIASSKASAEVQMPPFHTYIKRRRNMLGGQPSLDRLGIRSRGGLYEVAEIWLAWLALADRRVIAGTVAIQYDRFAEMDAETKRKWVEMLLKQGTISSTMANLLSGLIDDPAAALQDAKDELAEAQDFDDFDQRLNEALANVTAGDGAGQAETGTLTGEEVAVAA